MGNLNKPNMRFSEFDGNWVTKKLGDIGRFSKGKGISKSDISDEGTTECIRYGELYTSYCETIDSVISRTMVSELGLFGFNGSVVEAGSSMHPAINNIATKKINENIPVFTMLSLVF